MAAPSGPQVRLHDSGRQTALGWRLRLFPEPEAPVRKTAAADRAAIATRVAALRAWTPGRA